jgi:hypothetical protein
MIVFRSALVKKPNRLVRPAHRRREDQQSQTLAWQVDGNDRSRFGAATFARPRIFPTNSAGTRTLAAGCQDAVFLFVCALNSWGSLGSAFVRRFTIFSNALRESTSFRGFRELFNDE